MIVSHQRRFIFVHVSKTGGTSIERALDAYRHPAPDTRWNRLRCKLGLQWDHRRYVFRQHDTIRVAQRVLPEALFDGYFKFAFVRNPWDWLVSLYTYLRQTPNHHRHGQVRAMDFASYVDFEIRRGRRSQSAFITDARGQLSVDFVGRFEQLTTDFAQVCGHLGLGEVALPHRNVGQQRERYQSYYDDRTRQRVAEHWAEDIHRFGYGFQDPRP